jgi:hypothetical protein
LWVHSNQKEKSKVVKMSEIVISALAQFNVLLIAIMLSGLIVKMGNKHGTIRGDYHFKKFYVLFALFVAENVCIAILGEYLLVPLFEVVLLKDYFKVGMITASMILLCNIWFSHVFRFKYRLEMLILFVLFVVVTALAFFVQPPTLFIQNG